MSYLEIYFVYILLDLDLYPGCVPENAGGN